MQRWTLQHKGRGEELRPTLLACRCKRSREMLKGLTNIILVLYWQILVMEIFCRNMLNWFGSCTMMKIVLLATLNGQCRLRSKTAMFLHRMRSCGVSMGHR